MGDKCFVFDLDVIYAECSILFAVYIAKMVITFWATVKETRHVCKETTYFEMCTFNQSNINYSAYLFISIFMFGAKTK